MTKILIVDDDELVREHIWKVLLQICSVKADLAGDGEEAIGKIRNGSYEIIFLDIFMPRLNGLQVLRWIREEKKQVDVIMISGLAQVDQVIESLKLGADDFIKKPFRPKDISVTFSRYWDRRHPSRHVLASRLDSYIQKHFSQSSLNLQDLCSTFSISLGYGCRLFSEHIGITFRKRLAYYRIEYAKELLEKTDLSMYLIAEQCGFKNQRRFTEVFHRLEKMPPRRYRQGELKS